MIIKCCKQLCEQIEELTSLIKTCNLVINTKWFKNQLKLKYNFSPRKQCAYTLLRLLEIL